MWESKGVERRQVDTILDYIVHQVPGPWHHRSDFVSQHLGAYLLMDVSVSKIDLNYTEKCDFRVMASLDRDANTL